MVPIEQELRKLSRKEFESLPDDLKRFKKITLGHAVIVGQKTFESIGKPLPNRTNIVLTNDKNFKVEGVVISYSIPEALKKAEEALKWLHDAGKQFEMPVVTEVRGENQVDLIAEYADILQIGARNMYDQDLLIAVGRKKKPVLFKRHFGAGIEVQHHTRPFCKLRRSCKNARSRAAMRSCSAVIWPW